MLTSDRIEPKPATKMEPSKLTPVQQIAARLAVLKRQRNDIDGASLEVKDFPDREPRPSYCNKSYLTQVVADIDHENDVLELALSVAKPDTACDVLIMTAVCAHRLDFVEDGLSLQQQEGEHENESDRRIVADTIRRVVPALEIIAGITLEELGLDNYSRREKSPEELVVGVEAFKESLASRGTAS
jgi:hypothetical protein